MNPDDVVLVALVNTARDLELATREHWYRLPTRHAPKHFSGAQYIAFYLPQSFGERKWSIDTYAEVRGHELSRRVDLIPDETDHPRANELYYKLQLGAAEQRVPPIRSKRARRILYLWTNWDKFSTARDWNDLYLRTPAHDKLYEALRAANMDVEREMLVREGRSRYRVDMLVLLPYGRIGVSIGDAAVRERWSKNGIGLTVTAAQVENHIERVRDTIRDAAQELK
jgi:hypothetical protein